MAPRILKFVSMLFFLIYEKEMCKEIAPGTLRFDSMLFSIFEKGVKKKIAPDILIFVSMLFLIFEKGMNKKICSRTFKIRKYASFNI